MPHAYIFRRKVGVPVPGYDGPAGHAGWAFDTADGGICCGATENHSLKPWIPVGGDNGAWQSVEPNIAAMEAKMRALHYDDYKVVVVAKPDYQSALTVAANSLAVGYSAFGNNCLDHAYEVLLHYGAIQLPLPTDYPLPNDWFTAAVGEHDVL